MSQPPDKPLDRDGFLVPRPPHLTDEEWEVAQEQLRSDLLEAGWKRLIRAIEDDDAYPSPEYLADLLEEGPIPAPVLDWVQSYLAGRLRGAISRRGRPLARPENLHVEDRALFASTGGLLPKKAYAVRRVRRRYRRYKAIETRKEPRRRNRPRMRYVEDRGVWVVKNPKAEARRRVADRLYVSERTLETWEREARDGYGG